jgi:beta-barrel assembly-enhancing protease
VRQREDTGLTSYAGLAAMALAIINPVLAAGVSGAAQASQLRYQRQLEEEADYRGLQYMAQAGFDPQAMPRFLRKMRQEDRLSADQVPPYFRSHPLSQDRLSYIERTLRTFQWNQTAPTDTFELERVQAILRASHEPRTRLTAEYERRVKEHPDDPKALALLGTVFLSYNDWQRAAQALEQAGAKGVRLDRELGLAYLRLGQHDRARQTLRRQIEIDPEDAGAHNFLCSLSLQTGELGQAEQECRAAIRLDPRLDEAYVTLAQVTDRQGKAGESRLLLAQGMELQGRLEAAFGQYQRAAHALGPDHPRAEEVAKKVEEMEEILAEMRRMGGR